MNQSKLEVNAVDVEYQWSWWVRISFFSTLKWKPLSVWIYLLVRFTLASFQMLYHRFRWYATLENKTPAETFPNISVQQSCVLLTYRIEIHQLQPLVWPSSLLYVMLSGCDWWISIRSVNNNTQNWRKIWKRFRGCFVFQSRVSTKTVVRSVFHHLSCSSCLHSVSPSGDNKKHFSHKSTSPSSSTPVITNLRAKLCFPTGYFHACKSKSFS